jgi:small-conductance mechanosensitive channel
MDSAARSASSAFDRLTSPEVLAEIVAIVLALLLGMAAAHFGKQWHQRRSSTPPAGRASWHTAVIEGGVILASYFGAVVVLLGLRALLALADMHVAMVDIALRLIVALLLVRLGVYLLALLLGPKSWVRTWDNRITLFVWLAISFELLGWFNDIEARLDSLDLIPGKVSFSLWALLKSIVVVTGFILVASVIARTIERRVMAMDSVAMSTRIGIAKFSQFFLVGLGILLGVNATGIDLTALTVLTGAIGIGLGFGLQAIASNFVSGFVLLMDKSIKPGDVISFTGTTGTSTENFGWVQELRGRYVVVRDRDGVETLVPNQNLITTSVINWSYSDQRVRLRLPVMISYQDDPEKALELLVEAAARHPRILRDPAPVSRLMSFENYGMRLEARFWIRDPMNGVNNVRSDINREIWRLFKHAGITIPVAQHEVRVVAPRELPGAPGAD